MLHMVSVAFLTQAFAFAYFLKKKMEKERERINTKSLQGME